MAKQDCPECSGKKSVSAGPYNGRYYRHCHRCGWTKSDDLSIELRGARKQTPTSTGTRQTDGREEEPSPEALAWLGRYGVSWSDLLRYGGGMYQGRVVFKCPAFSALRRVRGDRGPKWLTRVTTPLGASRIDEWGWGKGNTLVVAEDSLAALKAALAGFHGFPLLGTNVAQLSPTRLKGYRVRVLTDPDDAGTLAGRKLLWALRGSDVKVISGKEPKEYTLEELRTLCS